MAVANHGLLPPALSELDRTGRVPKNAVHTVFGLTMLGDFVAVHILHSGLAALTWWANAMVFFATLTFAAVNLANIFYFRRFAPQRFSLWPNLVVPLFGAISTFYVMYETFFVALWSTDFRTGRSVVIFSVLVFLLFVLIVVVMAMMSPRRLRGEAPIEADSKPSV